MTTAVILALYVAAYLAFATMCFLKDKPWFGVLGLLLSPIFSIVGTCRLAKPGSWWYRHRYGLEKQTRANFRFAPAPVYVPPPITDIGL